MFVFLQSVIAIALCACIVVQHRASGLSATFGGSGTTNVVKRRGAEQAIYKLTIYLAIAFFGLALLEWFV